MPKDGSSWLYQRFSCAIGALVLQHLGIEHPFDVKHIMEDMVKYATKYFTEDQFKEESDSNWLLVIQQPWFMALLLNDQASVRTLCTWFISSRQPEYAGPIDYAIVPLLNLFASIYGNDLEPEEMAELRNVASKSKSKVISSLLACFDSFQLGDSKEFSRNFAVGLQAFAKSIKHKVKKDKMLPLENLFSAPHSIAWSTAELNSLELPDLPPELRAFFITRISLGLNPDQQ